MTHENNGMNGHNTQKNTKTLTERELIQCLKLRKEDFI